MAAGASEREVEFTSVLGKDELLFRHMTVREELGRMTEISVEVLRKHDKPVVNVKSLLGTMASVEILIQGSTKKIFNGYVVGCTHGGSRGRFYIYRLELRPWLWYLNKGQDCKIFQNMTTVEVIKKVFADYSTQKIQDKLVKTYPSRIYCVQYRESDFDFVSRLMEEEGIYYYFTYAKNQHTMVLCDAATAHVPITGNKLDFAETETKGNVRDDVIWEWKRSDTVQSQKYVHTDFDYLNPKVDLKKQNQVGMANFSTKPADLEVFDYPGNYDVPTQASAGQARADVRADEFEVRQIIGHGLTSYRPMSVGDTFQFAGHDDAGEYLVIGGVYEVDFGDHEGRYDQHVGPGYRLRFDAVQKKNRFVPARLTPRPVVKGPQTAWVVGPVGTEIYTEQHGRIKVQFHWDRIGTKNENSSCWIRVAYSWAGKGWGMISLPRIGHEVVVSFLEGDPDRPLVTGSVYNADNITPYELPAHATVSGWRSRSSMKGATSAFNELRFEDAIGKEYVWFQAQKDYYRWVRENSAQWIGKDEKIKIKDNRTEEIGKNLKMNVKQARTENVGTDYNLKVSSDYITKTGGNHDLKVTKDIRTMAFGNQDTKILGNTQLQSIGSIKVESYSSIDQKSFTGTTSESMLQMSMKAGTNMLAEGLLQVKVKGGLSVLIEAGMNISLMAGGSFVTIGPMGVDISGPLVKINSGGSGSSAGSANSAASASPATPAEAATLMPVMDWKDPLPYR